MSMNNDGSTSYFVPPPLDGDVPYNVYETFMRGLPRDFTQFLPTVVFPDHPRHPQRTERGLNTPLPSFTTLNDNINSDASDRLRMPPSAEQITALRGAHPSSDRRQGIARRESYHPYLDQPPLPEQRGTSAMRATRNPPQGMHRQPRFVGNQGNEQHRHGTSNNEPSRIPGSSHRPFPMHRYARDPQTQGYRTRQVPVPPQNRDTPSTFQRLRRGIIGFDDDDDRDFGAPSRGFTLEDEMLHDHLSRRFGGYEPGLPPGGPNRGGNGRGTDAPVHGYLSNRMEGEMRTPSGGYGRSGGPFGGSNRAVGMNREGARNEGRMDGNRDWRRDINSGGWPGDEASRYRNSRRRENSAGASARPRMNPHEYHSVRSRMNPHGGNSTRPRLHPHEYHGEFQGIEDAPASMHEALANLFNEVFTVPSARPETLQSFRVAMGTTPGQGIQRMAQWLLRSPTFDGPPIGEYEEFIDMIARTGGAVNRGASDAEIDGLRTDKVTKKKVKTENSEEEDKCAICLGEYEEGEEVKTLPCGHVFHGECIGRWLKVNRVCPFCKKSIRDGDDSGGNASGS